VDIYIHSAKAVRHRDAKLLVACSTNSRISDCPGLVIFTLKPTKGTFGKCKMLLRKYSSSDTALLDLEPGSSRTQSYSITFHSQPEDSTSATSRFTSFSKERHFYPIPNLKKKAYEIIILSVCLYVPPHNLVFLYICCRGNLITEPLPSNGHLFWLHYSEFQPSCHIAFKSCWTLCRLCGPRRVKYSYSERKVDN
jgi:hypothetical protein